MKILKIASKLASNSPEGTSYEIVKKNLSQNPSHAIKMNLCSPSYKFPTILVGCEETMNLGFIHDFVLFCFIVLVQKLMMFLGVICSSSSSFGVKFHDVAEILNFVVANSMVFGKIDKNLKSSNKSKRTLQIFIHGSSK